VRPATLDSRDGKVTPAAPDRQASSVPLGLKAPPEHRALKAQLVRKARWVPRVRPVPSVDAATPVMSASPVTLAALGIQGTVARTASRE